MPGIPAFFTTYLLLPIMATVIGSIALVINKKNELMSSKRLIVTILTSALVLSLSGFFGLIDLWFVPFFFLLVQGISLLVGILFTRRLVADMGPFFSDKPVFISLITLTTTALGAALFSLLFNYFSTLPYGLWAASSIVPFLIPVLFTYTFASLIAVPNEIYKLWYYPSQADEIILEGVDYYRLMLLDVQIYKDQGDKAAPIKVTARTNPEMVFSDWFQKFIDDYNHKFPNDLIHTFDEAGNQYGWLFYCLKPTIFRFRHAIDYERTIHQNNLREDYLIVAKRVVEIS